MHPPHPLRPLCPSDQKPKEYSGYGDLQTGAQLNRIQVRDLREYWSAHLAVILVEKARAYQAMPLSSPFSSRYTLGSSKEALGGDIWGNLWNPVPLPRWLPPLT